MEKEVNLAKLRPFFEQRPFHRLQLQLRLLAKPKAQNNSLTELRTSLISNSKCLIIEGNRIWGFREACIDAWPGHRTGALKKVVFFFLSEEREYTIFLAAGRLMGAEAGIDGAATT